MLGALQALAEALLGSLQAGGVAFQTIGFNSSFLDGIALPIGTEEGCGGP